MNIRKETCLIIKRGAEYLVGTILYSTDLRWSRSPWDAWTTRDWDEAKYFAKLTGGDLWLWNPVAGQLREARYERSH